ncbi:316_t:CDS:2, partial [Funneliformis caledonium]
MLETYPYLERRPDTTSTSIAKHFATCVVKPVIGCLAIPIVFNEIPIHNPNNVEALKISDHDPIFKDTYCKTRHYPYNSSTLDFLSNKTSLFLLKYFCSIFQNQNNSIPLYTDEKKKKLKGYKLATLGKEVDLRYLSTAYSTSRPSQSGLCDCCRLQLNNDDVVPLTCGHGYHSTCYSRRCIYCENFYKNG